MGRVQDIRIESYDDAVGQLKGKNERRLCHNTRLVQLQRIRDASEVPVCVRFHATDIVAYYRDGMVMLDSGGYRTVTTKRRINRCLPVGYSLYQERKVWKLHREGNRERTTSVRPYEDLMTLHGVPSVLPELDLHV